VKFPPSNFSGGYPRQPRVPHSFAFFANEWARAGPAYAALLIQAPLGKAVRRPMIATS
jgi:hypothetical protein